jgi:G3E family GTPase
MPIPTNLITGFLGVGKTTAIRHLLATRPADERWAVLVNEFGQVGVDDMLLDAEGVAVRQVPGGCLCCVSSQAFTVGLNRIIREQRPDRILIEPSGLGHPARIIDSLSGPFYDGVLDLRATITLMDARHLASPRHRSHDTWTDQLRLADVLVAAKADLYGDDERAAFHDFALTLVPRKARLALVTAGALDPDWLALPRDPARRAHCVGAHPPPDDHDHGHGASGYTPAPDASWQLMDTLGEGYWGLSWLPGPGIRFRRTALETLLTGMPWDRVKGVLPTDDGWLRINRVAGEGNPERCDPPPSARGRLEIIHHEPPDREALDRLLRDACLPASPQPEP